MIKNSTRNDIILSINNNVGIPMSLASKIVQDILGIIMIEFENGNDVKISSFGTFKVKHKKMRIGRNPKTGVESIISARNVVTFNASNILKTKIK